MSWFRYIKLGEELPSQNYKYGNLKRRIFFPTVKQNIEKDTWLFVDLNEHKIDSFINSQLNEVTDDRSYIVSYENESENSTEFICVPSKIVDNFLYFQTAETHLKNEEIQKEYNLYYKTKKIKNLIKVTNGENEEYQETLEQISSYSSSVEVDRNLLLTVNIEDIAYYGFSFLNQNVDWKSGESTIAGAKVSGIFTGPNFNLNCEVGPDRGKIKLTILSVKNEATPENIFIENNLIIDLFSTTKDNKIVYSKEDLPKGDYLFEIVCDEEKNALSSSNKVKINSFSYSLDQFLTFGEEQISPYLLTKNITGVS
jgi:hypothetical protein